MHKFSILTIHKTCTTDAVQSLMDGFKVFGNLPISESLDTCIAEK